MKRALLVALLAGCGGDGGQVDAAPPPDAPPPPPDARLPDAALCTAPEVIVDVPVTAGAHADLWGAGPGAWVALRSGGGPPRDVLYVEAYRDLFEGLEVTVDSFENWAFECRICVFLATGCPAITVGVTDGHPDGAPATCDALWMLDRGAIALQSFVPDPPAGELAGQVTPIGGDSSIRLLQVYATGDPHTATGYGNRMTGGGCIELPGLSFSGSWGGGAVDAGP